MPDLVIATSAVDAYPGGVIAVRAADWIAAGSTTATSEANALASTGVVVRETQQVASVNVPFLDEDAYQNADDTLEMSASAIGVEDGMTYFVITTYLLEGEWDLTNEALLRECSNLEYRSVALGGAHGSVGNPEASPTWEATLLCRIPHFAAFSLRLDNVDTTDTLHFRFFTQTGTSAEWLIDQIVFLPRALSPNWLLNQDIRLVGPNSSIVDIIDGADGGDDNGKFTRFVPVTLDDFAVTGAASADYQQKSDGDDAEYHQKITTSSNETLFNSVGTDSEANAWGYGLYCARYREQQTYSVDNFDNRDTSGGSAPLQDMGIDEQGYGYNIQPSSSGADPEAYVDGADAILRLNSVGSVFVGWGSSDQSSSAQDNQGAQLDVYDQWDLSGELEWTAGSIGGGAWRILNPSPGTSPDWQIEIEPVVGSWRLGYGGTTTFTNIGASTHDISGWFGINSPLGFRLEIKRYVIRARVWDASGAEPSTWDEEMFKPALNGAVKVDYDYSDNLTFAGQAYQQHNFQLGITNVGDTGAPSFPYDVKIHTLQFDYDPYGDPDDMYVRMERPPPAALPDMTIPWGCPYWVSWGNRDWTDPSGLTWDLVYWERVWNDTAAAEIQRAETTAWWFRSIHDRTNPQIMRYA